MVSGLEEELALFSDEMEQLALAGRKVGEGAEPALKIERRDRNGKIADDRDGNGLHVAASGMRREVGLGRGEVEKPV